MNKYVKVAAHALIRKGNKYLVLRRALVNDYMPGYWDVPGGTIEFGEKVEVALVREILEETKLKIKVGKIIFAYSFKSGEFRHQFQLVYACDYLSGEVLIDPEEHDEYKWLTIMQIKKIKTIAFLKELLKNI